MLMAMTVMMIMAMIMLITAMIMLITTQVKQKSQDNYIDSNRNIAVDSGSMVPLLEIFPTFSCPSSSIPTLAIVSSHCQFRNSLTFLDDEN